MGGGTYMSIMLGENVTCAGWQVTLCDPIWHASSRSGAVLVAQTAIHFFAFFTFLDGGVCQLLWPVDGHILHYGIISSCASVGAWENGFSVAGYETDWAHSMGP